MNTLQVEMIGQKKYTTCHLDGRRGIGKTEDQGFTNTARQAQCFRTCGASLSSRLKANSISNQFSCRGLGDTRKGVRRAAQSAKVPRTRSCRPAHQDQQPRNRRPRPGATPRRLPTYLLGPAAATVARARGDSVLRPGMKPTWDDCQQLLQTLLTTEERQRVLLEARKNVQGPDGRPTQLPNEIDEVFPLIRPTDWNINTAAGRERHCLYRQTLLAGLKGAGRCPTNLAKVLTLRLEDEHSLLEDLSPSLPTTETSWLKKYPHAWAETAGMGLAEKHPSLIINLKASATPIAIKQYPISHEAREEIRPHINRLLQQGILRPCRSPWNTPLLPVKKPGTGDYRPVQDFREVNRTEDIHPTVPNPYNLLSTLPPSHIWYMVLDLKDAFFCLRLSPQSQPLFAFEWKDPETGFSGQLTWTRLPQGFKNSPTLFSEALHQDLADFWIHNPNVILLQNIDDLLLAAESEQDCLQGTQALLQKLGDLGYRASAKKAPLCKKQVTYLGYKLQDGQRWLTEERKQAVALIPPPKSSREVCEFWGSAGFCHLWIPSFAELAAPLYPLTKATTPFTWEKEHQKAFDDIKRALLSAPALSLPNINKPFTLYVDEKAGVAKGVLTQQIGPWKRPVVYFSKKTGQCGCRVAPMPPDGGSGGSFSQGCRQINPGSATPVVAPHVIEAVVQQPPSMALKCADWVQLLPMALFWVRNTASVLGLTPFEILFGGPPPIMDVLPADPNHSVDSSSLQARLRALQIIQNQIWKPLAAVYQDGNAAVPHPFQIGDSVYIRRHQSKTLEPRWKGPYTVLLTTPMALKVDGIAA
ncbi:hypothetical protein NN561_018994 [Cricetulus griseus]